MPKDHQSGMDEVDQTHVSHNHKSGIDQIDQTHA
jgi:hypothetical protein